MAIYILAQLQAWTSIALVAPSFGASCVLIFAVPESPLAQPRNVIGGHLVSTACGLATFAILGTSPIALGVGVATAILMMIATRTLHPPAGGDPLVVILTAASPSFLLEPVLLGTFGAVLTGVIYHWLVSGRVYPLPARRQ